MSSRLWPIALSGLLLAATAAPSTAQQSGSATAINAGVECGGQYECIEDRPLSLAEAEGSIAYPHPAQSGPAEHLAATQPTSAPPASER
jgi:hypothetical protein